MQVETPRWNEHVAGAALPPLVPGLPLLGNALDMNGNALPFLVAAYKHYGPIFRVRAANRRFTVIAGPEANQFMAEADGDLLRSRELWQDYAKEWNSPHLIGVLNGEPHAQIRKVMKPGYARGVITSRLPEVVNIVRTHAQTLEIGTAFSVLPFLQRVVSDQLGMLLVGRVPGEYLDDMRRYVRTSLNVLVIRQWPRLMLRDPAYQRSKRRVAMLAQEVIAAHRSGALDTPSSLIADLAAAHDANPQGFTDADLLTAILGPYIAGLDTVANTCTFLVYELLRHPAILASLRAEVDMLFAQGITVEGLKQLHTLHGAAMEALRLYPVGGVNQRTATRPFSFAGFLVPSDETVIVAGGVAHYLPTFYPDPTAFDIGRYRVPRNEHRQRGAFAPFGTGPHTCLGAGLAEVQIMVTTAALLHALDLEAMPGYRPKVGLDPTITLGRGFRVRARALRHQ